MHKRRSAGRLGAERGAEGRWRGAAEPAAGAGTQWPSGAVALPVLPPRPQGTLAQWSLGAEAPGRSGSQEQRPRGAPVPSWELWRSGPAMESAPAKWRFGAEDSRLGGF